MTQEGVTKVAPSFRLITLRVVLCGTDTSKSWRYARSSGSILAALQNVLEDKLAKSRKVIITCAVTGAIHTPSMSPYLPITPDEITADALRAAEAGAAILHLHARNPEDGRPDQTPEAFARFLGRIKQQTNAALNITTGGSPFMKVEERVKPAATFKPEVASLNMGSFNFFGLLGGIGPHPEDVMHMRRTADRLFGDDYRWSVLGAGASQMRVAAQSIALGGNVRVGLEDSIWAGPGKLAKSNADQVILARQLIESMGMSVASPDEAREILDLKGGDQVAF